MLKLWGIKKKKLGMGREYKKNKKRAMQIIKITAPEKKSKCKPVFDLFYQLIKNFTSV